MKRLSKRLKHLLKIHSSKHKIKELLQSHAEIKLELGSGSKAGTNNWLTLDIAKECDIYWDLRKGVPFPDNSVSQIYSSHFFEHLTFNEAQTLLKDCLRALRIGGLFSICVPNARVFIDGYLDSSFDKNQYIGYQPANNETTQIDLLNYIAYMDGHHKYMFDQDNLNYVLELAGFSNVKSRIFDKDLDILERDYVSIYALAEKQLQPNSI